MKVLLTGLAASLLVLMPAIAQTNSRPAESFRVVGTEPFWGMTIAKSGITYSTPNTQQVTFPYVAPLSAEGRPADMVRVYQLRGRTSGTLVLRQGACTDGMSDRRYTHTATLIMGNTVKEGCAIKQ